MHIIVANGI